MNIQLKNPELDREIKAKGYVMVPLLNEQELSELTLRTKEINNFPVTDMLFSNLQHHNKEYIDKARSFLKEFLFDKVFSYIENAEWVDGVYIIKPPGVGEFSNHQDWSMVDEKIARTYSVWIPLIDVDERNGTFCILEGSHNFFKGYRSSTIPWQYSGEKYQDIINKYRKPLKIKKGYAVIFDNAMIHATTPNNSNESRIAVIIGLKPTEEKLLHFYQTGQPDKVEVFEVDADFFSNYDYKSRPSAYKSLGVIDNEVINISPEEFENAIIEYKQRSGN